MRPRSCSKSKTALEPIGLAVQSAVAVLVLPENDLRQAALQALHAIKNPSKHEVNVNSAIIFDLTEI
jgi:hypothetical protein